MIYFVRHGETESNIRGVFAGQKDDSLLTEKGKDQAKTTAQNIKSQIAKIDRIIASPLKRTLETAQIIAQHMNFDLAKIEINSQIIEYETGSMTGKPFKEVQSIVLTAAQDVEDSGNFRQRISGFFKELSAKPEDVLVISHGMVGKMLETIKNNGNAKLFWDAPLWDNAAVIEIDWIK